MTGFHKLGTRERRYTCTVLIENTIENYLLPAYADHYALRK